MRCRRVLPVLLLAVFFAAAPARAAIITFDSLSVNQGETFTLGILVSDVSNLWSFQFDILFNSTVLTPIETTREGELLGTRGSTFFIPGFLPGEREDPDDPNSVTPDGMVRLTAGTLLPDAPGVSVAPGTPRQDLLPLAYITFIAIAGGDAGVALSSVSLLDPEGFAVRDFLGEPAESEVVDGTVTVIPTSSVPEPATLVLMGVGLLTVARRMRRRV